MSQTTNYAVFGRKVLEEIGHGWEYPSVWARMDLEEYGRACSNAMRVAAGTPRMPDPTPYLIKTPQGAAPAAVQTRQAAAPAAIQDVHVRPRNVREVTELVEDGIISKAQARVYLGLKPHWWSA